MFFAKINLVRLDAVTKYPSIPTYHAMGERGRLLPEVAVQFDGPVNATEQIDGTNVRIIVADDGTFLVGSRDELLYASTDLITNPSQGIVAALRVKVLGQGTTWPTAVDHVPPAGVLVLFGELFGGKINSAKQYTRMGSYGLRLFDAAPLTARELSRLLAQTPPEIAQWRAHVGQPFYTDDALHRLAEGLRIECVPQLGTLPTLPTELVEMAALLLRLAPYTQAALADGLQGRAEGIVFRSPARTHIAKARFEDYTRTLAPRSAPARR